MFRIHRKQQKCTSKSSLNICVVKIIQGGGVAAPIAGEILGEVLPYLEVQKNEQAKEIVTVPNVIGLTIQEARKILKEAGLELKLEGEAPAEEKVIENQTPKEGISLTKGTGVIVE